MGKDEVGTVLSAQNLAYTARGTYYTQIAVTMKDGVTRICRVDDESTTLLPPGTTVNLRYAKRVY